MVASPRQYLKSPHHQKQQGKKEESTGGNGKQWEGHTSREISHVLNPVYSWAMCLLWHSTAYVKRKREIQNAYLWHGLDTLQTQTLCLDHTASLAGNAGTGQVLRDLFQSIVSLVEYYTAPWALNGLLVAAWFPIRGSGNSWLFQCDRSQGSARDLKIMFSSMTEPSHCGRPDLLVSKLVQS